MITFNSVTKAFDPDSTGVFDLSFHINPGEMVFITGPSGSGKTTLMRLLTREYSPSQGEIEFDGLQLSKLRDRDLHTHRRKIGVVFQDYRLLPELNVWENVALPLSIIGKSQREIEERVTDLLKLVQLTSKASLFPRQLSGGEAQRISIARALAMAPAVICADEPTGNLDRDTATAIAHLLHTINKLGTTVIFATHDPHVISLFADKRRLHLEEGKLRMDTFEESEPPRTKEKPMKPQQEKIDTGTDAAKKQTKDSKSDSPQPSENKEVKLGFFARLFGKKAARKTDLPEGPTSAQQNTSPKPDTSDDAQHNISSNKSKQTVKVVVESLDLDQDEEK